MSNRAAASRTSPRRVITLVLTLAVLAYLAWQQVSPMLTEAAAADQAPATPAVVATDPAGAAAALDLLDTLVVAPDSGAPYDRAGDYGSWADTDGNECDARNDILARDLTDIVVDTDGCTVLSGTLTDAYTPDADGSPFVLAFQRGEQSSQVQIDHMVPLSYANAHGADAFTKEQRIALANDPANLRATYGPTNSSKGDRGPGSWLPERVASHCDYVAQFVTVLSAYDLSIALEDQQVAASVLQECTSTTA